MYRLIVKANNIRQVAATIEAHGMLHLTQRIERLSDTREWIADVVAKPEDRYLMTRLNEWQNENAHATVSLGYGFPAGSLLYWTWVDSTLIHAHAEADMHLTEALSSPRPS